jgi:hypothetical protein
MEALKSNYPVPAVRKHKLKQMNGVQKLCTNILQKIEDLPPKLNNKVHKSLGSNLTRNSPGNRPVAKVKKPTSPVIKRVQETTKNDSVILSDDDDFYSKLTFDEAEQSLEDEIFEELEKVAHDEAKLNAAIQNFDKILNEYSERKVKDLMTIKKPEIIPRKEEKPSAIPKPLQKSKTCSIIESKCILKKQEQMKTVNKEKPQKVDKPIKVENIETIPSANYYQLTKSLWNLQEFENFAKSAQDTQRKIQLGPRKSEGALTMENVKSTLPKAKSVWEIASTPNATSTPRPVYSRQSSISKIPIKSSKLSTSMMQLNSSSTTISTHSNGCALGNSSYSSYANTPSRLKKSSVYASTLGLSTSNNQSQKLAITAPRRSSLGPSSKSATTISNYSETKASLQRRNLMSSSNSLNKMSIPIAVGNKSTRLSPAKSEMSIHSKFAIKAAHKQPQNKCDQNQQNRINFAKVKRNDADILLEKCLVKGQELLRKAEEFNDTKNVIVYDNKTTAPSSTIKNAMFGYVKKRDYIAKQQNVSLTKESSASDVSMNMKMSSVNANEIKTSYNHNDNRKMLDKTNVNAITNRCNMGGNDHQSEETVSESSPVRTTVTTKVVTVTEAPSIVPIINEKVLASTLESTCEVIPVVLDAVESEELSDKIKDYNSDCSDDSGHISNENEEIGMTMDVNKPRKISEDLLEIFEKKTTLPLVTSKAKVIELNHVNLIKSSLDIYPTLNKTCKSEVKFYINKY